MYSNFTEKCIVKCWITCHSMSHRILVLYLSISKRIVPFDFKNLLLSWCMLTLSARPFYESVLDEQYGRWRIQTSFLLSRHRQEHMCCQVECVGLAPAPVVIRYVCAQQSTVVNVQQLNGNRLQYYVCFDGPPTTIVSGRSLMDGWIDRQIVLVSC